jgi:hypothetical protein
MPVSIGDENTSYYLDMSKIKFYEQVIFTY